MDGRRTTATSSSPSPTTKTTEKAKPASLGGPVPHEWPPHASLLLSQAVCRLGERNWPAVAETLRTWLGPAPPPPHLEVAPQSCAAQYARMAAALAPAGGGPQLVLRKMLAMRTRQLERELRLAWIEELKLAAELASIEAGTGDNLLPHTLQHPHSQRKPHNQTKHPSPADRRDIATPQDARPFDSDGGAGAGGGGNTKMAGGLLNADASPAHYKGRTAHTSKIPTELNHSPVRTHERTTADTQRAGDATPSPHGSRRRRNSHTSSSVQVLVSESLADPPHDHLHDGDASPSRRPPPYPRVSVHQQKQHTQPLQHHQAQHQKPQSQPQSFQHYETYTHQSSSEYALNPVDRADTPRSTGARTTADSEQGDGESGAEFSDGVHEQKRARVEHKTWKRTAMVIWNRITDHRAGNAFLKIVRDKYYTEYIKQPMSLDLVKSRIRDGTTRTTAEFHRDVLNILANAIMFNSEDSEIYAMAQEMIEYTDMEMRNLLVYNRSSDEGL